MADHGDQLMDQITRFLAEQRVDDAAVARTRERWLRQMAAEDGTFAGVLLDLAEQGRVVVVTTAAGRRHRGQVRAVGLDFCVLSATSGLVLLARQAIASVRTQPDSHRSFPVGDRDVALGADLATTLAGLAGDRPHAQVVTTSGDAMAGELRTVSIDALTLRLDGEAACAYVPIDAVAELTVR